MDSLKKVIIFFLFAFFANSSYANYAAGIRPNSYCYSTSTTSYRCSGPMFGSEGAAAEYMCQQLGGQNSTPTNIRPWPNSTQLGIRTWGATGWAIDCLRPGLTTLTTTDQVQAMPDCGMTGTPILNFTPMTCAGEPPMAPPIACAQTNGLTITAFHAAPVAATGCYAMCRYLPQIVDETVYNGLTYFAGVWSGAGEICQTGDRTLIGGIPGNAQNVGGGGGLTANDLLGLAREDTLQQLLANAQSSASLANSNKTILEAIKNSTEQMANAQPDKSDPDGFEAAYRAGLVTSPDTPGGGLQALPKSTVDVSGTFSNIGGFLGGSSNKMSIASSVSPACPVGPSFTVKGTEYQIDFSFICEFASIMGYLIVVSASLTGVRIFIGGAYQ